MKIELTELQRILSRSETINETLNTELTNINDTLQDICANVSSSELTAANQNLTNAINDISETVKANLPKVIEFLNAQINSYQTTNENIKQSLDSLISEVDSSLGQ